jgi:hypothetical protein
MRKMEDLSGGEIEGERIGDEEGEPGVKRETSQVYLIHSLIHL